MLFAIMVLTNSLHAQRRVAVLIVGNYYGTGVPLVNQWNDGEMGGGVYWGEFWTICF